MTLPSDLTEEEYTKAFYEHAKEEGEDLADYMGAKGENRKRFIFSEVAYTGYLDLIKNDKELNLSEADYQHVRQWAFVHEVQKLQEVGVAREEIKDEMEKDDVKDYFRSLGFGDLLEDDAWKKWFRENGFAEYV